MPVSANRKSIPYISYVKVANMNLMHGVYNFKIENPDITLEHERDSPKLKMFFAVSKKLSLALAFPWKTK
jgi:hypothetical protein